MNLNFTIDKSLLEVANEGANIENGVYGNDRIELEVAAQSNIILSGYCKKAFGNGDLIIDYKGIDCILELQDFTTIDGTIVRHLAQNKVGKNISFRVKKIDGDKVYIERKSVIAEVRKMYDGLQVGHNISGVITGIDQLRGGFVDIGGDIQGIIPKSMIENVFVNDISDHLYLGEKVNVKVIELERDANGTITHLALNRKILLPTFDELTKDINTYDVVIAKVKTVSANGIHCSLNAHLDIFCGFVSGIRVASGDKVRVLVKQIRADRQRINGNILGKL
ncbi:MAG: S1 RNA-binding domain-containing protein [Clostridium sp.]